MQENEKECQAWNVAGSHEVRGSIPRSSTNFPLNNKASTREAPLLAERILDYEEPCGNRRERSWRYRLPSDLSFNCFNTRSFV